MNFVKKWYTYQKERFPVVTFGIYVLCIVVAVFCFCSNVSKNIIWLEENKVQYSVILPMFLVGFLQFLMVRIVDEFKDYDEDCKYRPYRPVPRGLIKLEELKILFIMCAVLQFVITSLINIYGLVYLLLMWVIFFIMTKGFFIKKFLDKYILVEVILDEIMMPVMVLFLSTFIFQNAVLSVSILKNIFPLLFMSYLVSCIVEIARKVRSKELEEVGVKTYTAVFGIVKAILILCFFETLLMITHMLILGEKYVFLVLALYACVIIVNILFVIKQNRVFAKLVELFGNLYIMLVYLSMSLLIL